MMEKELERRRRWPWKNLKNNGISGSSEGGSSPNPVKLFDEQDVARILQDQIRIGDEQIVEALHAAELKYSEEKKVLTEKLTDVNEKLVSALADITTKDHFIKLHIKVAEEAIIGWEKAEQETAEYKLELEKATQQRLATEDRASYLDATLKDLTQQLHVGREEHKKNLHETTLEKAQEFENLRTELEIKLEEVSKSLSDNRNLLIESQAENEVLYHALKDSSRMIAELNDMRAHTETYNKILQQVRLEGVEKENLDLRYKIQTITKELEIRSAELEYGRKNPDILYPHQADSGNTNVKLEDESSQLHMMVHKNLPDSSSKNQINKEMGFSRKEPEDSPRPRRCPLRRSLGEGLDILPWHALVHEGTQDSKDGINAVVERIAHVDEETRILKEALAKRNKELQASHLMCAKTASRLTVVEDELDLLRAEMTHFIDASSPGCSMSSMPVSKSRTPLSKSKNGSRTFGLMNGLGMECLAPYGLQSEPRSDNLYENGYLNYPHISKCQQQILGLRNPKTANDRKFDSTNVVNEKPSTKLTAAEGQFSSNTRNAENAESSKILQDGLDRLLNSLREAQLDSCLSNLAQVTNELSENCSHSTSFVSELSPTLPCVTSNYINSVQDLQEDREAVYGNLESANALIFQPEDYLPNIIQERATKDIQMQEQLDRAPEWEKDVELLSREITRAIHRVSDVKPHLREANDIVDALREELKAAEVRICELRLQQEQQKQEDELIEEKLLEIFLSHPGLAKTIRAADIEMNELHVKLAELEVELHDERRRHHDVVAKLRDLQQIHRGVGRNADSGGSLWEGSTESLMEEDDVSKGAGQEREMAAGASAECQRTILALGKHLKILGFSESLKLTTNSRHYPDFEKGTTESLELQQWLTQSSNQESSQKSNSVVCNGPTSVPASPGRLGLVGPSSPDLPVIVQRSVRTFRPLQLPEVFASNGKVVSNPIATRRADEPS
ncbi:filament-like plant protein 4 isoform X8 [Physcomitrium patens]|uniref:filament-like plant protein 4 isoform X8 n=1 Tax=Physcomitrium patens TaxID=3218 RepID=UPI003CCDD0DF